MVELDVYSGLEGELSFAIFCAKVFTVTYLAETERII
jgi:hypothetical protein